MEREIETEATRAAWQKLAIW